jgi:hypothetical protein
VPHATVASAYLEVALSFRRFNYRENEWQDALYEQQGLLLVAVRWWWWWQEEKGVKR